MKNCCLFFSYSSFLLPFNFNNFIISTINIGDNTNNITSNISCAGSTGILNTFLNVGTRVFNS